MHAFGGHTSLGCTWLHILPRCCVPALQGTPELRRTPGSCPGWPLCASAGLPAVGLLAARAAPVQALHGLTVSQPLVIEYGVSAGRHCDRQHALATPGTMHIFALLSATDLPCIARASPARAGHLRHSNSCDYAGAHIQQVCHHRIAVGGHPPSSLQQKQGQQLRPHGQHGQHVVCPGLAVACHAACLLLVWPACTEAVCYLNAISCAAWRALLGIKLRIKHTPWHSCRLG